MFAGYGYQNGGTKEKKKTKGKKKKEKEMRREGEKILVINSLNGVTGLPESSPGRPISGGAAWEIIRNLLHHCDDETRESAKSPSP